MKLEIKHLAPYLPYGLELQGDKVYTIDPLEMAYGYRNNIRYISIKAAFEDTLKPILRPLSDLTKKVHAGLVQLPISIESLDYFIKTPLASPYILVADYLLKEHYDVFNLIPEGLAIDLNTIMK